MANRFYANGGMLILALLQFLISRTQSKARDQGVATEFLGSFTTFSTFIIESLYMIRGSRFSYTGLKMVFDMTQTLSCAWSCVVSTMICTLKIK